MLKQEEAFTLIEMLIVLSIITLLLLLIIPNLSDKTESVHERGCDALKETVQTQINAYTLDTGVPPSSLLELIEKGYIKESQQSCENGENIEINSDGTVKR